MSYKEKQEIIAKYTIMTSGRNITYGDIDMWYNWLIVTMWTNCGGVT